MVSHAHYPPELVELLVEATSKLIKGKSQLIDFFERVEANPKLIAGLRQRVRRDKKGLFKAQIARELIQDLVRQGDDGIRPRRLLLKRVVEWSDFTTCWESDALQAEGLVSRIRRLVESRDYLTRLEKANHTNEARARQAEAKQREDARRQDREKRRMLLDQLQSIACSANPWKRGKDLETWLNDYFRECGISVRDSFEIRSDETGKPLEQIDGVVELRGTLFLVEVKWEKTPLGPGPVGQHLARVYNRNDTMGAILVSGSGFTEGGASSMDAFIRKRRGCLVEVYELIRWLELGIEGPAALLKKLEVAEISTKPLYRILAQDRL